jgi:hypothetical protein
MSSEAEAPVTFKADDPRLPDTTDGQAIVVIGTSTSTTPHRCRC